MGWTNVSLETDARHADALSDALMEVGALSVTVEDAWAGTDRETPQFGEPGGAETPLWETSRVVALFDPAGDLPERIARAAEAAGLEGLSEVRYAEVAEQDWVRLTQSQFEPIRVNARLWIVPSWHGAPDPSALNLILDPGLAFGTGSHPTTRLCLEWLCGNAGPGRSLLDYGCGSGILGIAGARLGAAPVVGVDIDPRALESAADNARVNGVAMDLRRPRDPLTETFDLVVANILTNPLCLLAPLLAGRLAGGGRIALSGILAAQAAQVIEAYAAYVPLRAGATLEGWVRLEGGPPA